MESQNSSNQNHHASSTGGGSSVTSRRDNDPMMGTESKEGEEGQTQAQAQANTIQLNDDRFTMKLTEEEIEKANTIKAALELDSHDPRRGHIHLTDFECVQWALTMTQENSLPTILTLISSFTSLREYYQLADYDLEEALRCVDEMTKEHPGLLLATDYSPSTGNCISVSDWAAAFQSPASAAEGPSSGDDHDQDCTSLVRGLYYILQAMNPTFMAMKVGISNLVECDGVSFESATGAGGGLLPVVVGPSSRSRSSSSNANANDAAADIKEKHQVMQQMIAELYMKYPQRHKETYLVHSPPLPDDGNAGGSGTPQDGSTGGRISQNFRDSIHMGYNNVAAGMVPESSGGQQRIDALFKVPTPQVAKQLMLNNIRELLTTRYRHQATFRLPPIEELDVDVSDTTTTTTTNRTAAMMYHDVGSDDVVEMPLLLLRAQSVGGNTIRGGSGQQQQQQGSNQEEEDEDRNQTQTETDPSSPSYHDHAMSPRGPSQSPVSE